MGGSLAEPPAEQGEDGEDGYHDQVGVEDGAADAGFVAGDPGPVRGCGQKGGDVEEGCPVGEGEERGGGKGH